MRVYIYVYMYVNVCACECMYKYIHIYFVRQFQFLCLFSVVLLCTIFIINKIKNNYSDAWMCTARFNACCRQLLLICVCVIITSHFTDLENESCLNWACLRHAIVWKASTISYWPCRQTNWVGYISVITVFIAFVGRSHPAHIIRYCECESLACTLIRFGFWPSTPTRPLAAFSIDLLSLMQTLTLECAVSVKGFVQSLRWMNGMSTKSVSYFDNCNIYYGCFMGVFWWFFRGQLIANVKHCTIKLRLGACWSSLELQVAMRNQIRFQSLPVDV